MAIACFLSAGIHQKLTQLGVHSACVMSGRCNRKGKKDQWGEGDKSQDKCVGRKREKTKHMANEEKGRKTDREREGRRRILEQERVSDRKQRK